MPELPEVETIRRDLSAVLVGKKIQDIYLRNSKVVRGSRAHLRSVLIGDDIKKIDRRGKLLIFMLSSDQYLLMHLKMTGQLFYVGSETSVRGGHSQTNYVDPEKNKHTHAIFTFIDGSKLLFNDMRMFGFIELVDDLRLQKSLSRFGIEPLTDAFTLDNFKTLFYKRTSALKNLLLNQQLIAGIGNIYADEICFESKIRPQRKISSLNPKEIAILFRSIEKILAKAVEARGTTFNSYVDGHGRKGNFVKFLRVYGRGGEKCRRCNAILKKIRVAERGAVFCDKCQN